MLNTAQNNIYQKAVSAIAAQTAVLHSVPTLYGPDNKPLKGSGKFRPSGGYAYGRTAGKHAGSMRKWNPSRLYRNQSEALERETIVARSVDLTNNDPHAAGVVDNFAVTVIGAGLSPHVTFERNAFPDLSKEEIKKIRAQQKVVYNTWYPFADAGNRMNFGQVQYLTKRNMMQYGEYLVLLPMKKDASRPYSLACQAINPMRLKTPTDKVTCSNIRDGVEIGDYGEPIAYWIKRADGSGRYLADVSSNFIRIEAKAGHRWKVLHGFICQEPEQVRGMPLFSAAMKYFRDLNDLLDSELVSNIVTAAIAIFIEMQDGGNPLTQAQRFADLTDTTTDDDGDSKEERWQEVHPGEIWYGNTGEKPHFLAAQRPGVTFDPFVKIIKKSIASSINLPYPIAFKDVDGVNFAGFRSAMLDAWRVFMFHRAYHGEGFCQPIFTMLQEEAYLRGDLDIKDFYSRMYAYTRAEWIGPPKGDIEPVKAANADKILNQAKLKTKQQSITERYGNVEATELFDQLEDEDNELKQRNLLKSEENANADN